MQPVVQIKSQLNLLFISLPDETDSDYEPGTVTEEAGQSTKVNPSTVVNKDVKTKTSSKAEKKLDSQITEIKKPQRKTKTNLLKKKADLQLSSQSRDPSRPILQKTGDEQSEEWCASSSQESTNRYLVKYYKSICLYVSCRRNTYQIRLTIMQFFYILLFINEKIPLLNCSNAFYTDLDEVLYGFFTSYSVKELNSHGGICYN